jgi:hypothetical protein
VSLPGGDAAMADTSPYPGETPKKDGILYGFLMIYGCRWILIPIKNMVPSGKLT